MGERRAAAVRSRLGTAMVAAELAAARELAGPNVELVVDVGANRGAWTREALTRFPECHCPCIRAEQERVRSAFVVIRFRASGVSVERGARGNRRNGDPVCRQ